MIHWMRQLIEYVTLVDTSFNQVNSTLILFMYIYLKQVHADTLLLAAYC